MRLTERCLRHDPPTSAESAETEKVAREILDDAFAAVDTSVTKTWAAVAGTVTTLAGISRIYRNTIRLPSIFLISPGARLRKRPMTC